MLMPSISRYMACQPWTIPKDAKLSQAQQLMREHGIRHLPVLDAGTLVGILSQRDARLIETIPGSDPDELTVEKVMVPEVYTVSADDSVDLVAERMAERKYGSAVVLNRRGAVEGIFTTVDALQVLADVLRRATT
jgi:acetoin utilization protein AcuB